MIEAIIKRIPKDLIATRCAVLMGGPSPEREVSLRSGGRVLAAMKRLGFSVVGIEADREMPARLRDEGVRLVFLATHGVPGEDGTIQGFLDTLGISYTGAGVPGSALAMDKLASKALLAKFGVTTPAYSLVERNAALETIVHDLASSVGFPMILKPVDGGSSLGVRLAADVSELRTSLELLMAVHDRIFAEAYVPGREITVSILEDSRGRPYCLPILELSPKNLFYDYECKTIQGKTDFLVPAKLGKNTQKDAETQGLLAHTRLLQRDFSRSDFIVDASGGLHYLETNSIPGLTDLSDLPAQAKAYGMSFEEVVLSALLGANRRSRGG